MLHGLFQTVDKNRDARFAADAGCCPGGFRACPCSICQQHNRTWVGSSIQDACEFVKRVAVVARAGLPDFQTLKGSAQSLPILSCAQLQRGLIRKSDQANLAPGQIIQEGAYELPGLFQQSIAAPPHGTSTVPPGVRNGCGRVAPLSNGLTHAARR